MDNIFQSHAYGKALCGVTHNKSKLDDAKKVKIRGEIMDKISIYVGLELVFGPILKDKQLEDKTFSSGSKIVDDDLVLGNLDMKINELWCTLYSKNEASNSGFSFDEAKEKELAPQLLEMINRLIERLNEINDGSYEVEDMITDHLKSLL